MSDSELQVSVVLTVYNKAAYLPATIASLRRQLPSTELELVFVDDSSSDDSIAVITELTADMPHVQIIHNTDNRGPSVRLNQGGRAARGRYLFFIDGDDIAPEGVLSATLALAIEHDADVILGKTQKVSASPESVLETGFTASPQLQVSPQPVVDTVEKGFLHMACLCHRDTFLRADGCDARVFIQDESLSLRLAHAANRLLLLSSTMVLVPVGDVAEASHLSADKSQQHVDQLLTFHNFLLDNPGLEADVRNVIVQKVASAGWKYYRKRALSMAKLVALRLYLQSKLAVGTVTRHQLEGIRKQVMALGDYRSVQ